VQIFLDWVQVSARLPSIATLCLLAALAVLLPARSSHAEA